ncbi:hypothetical protein EZV62_027435 [Acer yangbiense]|uniref:Uncharacterized protein n=1 Tax=Acer yangbiense TaxID=1000413 RepID=A0A5C7GTN9_9ROSI|nr:hypothetical protein EZV62_027435 [Acer yangbiense]
MSTHNPKYSEPRSFDEMLTFSGHNPILLTAMLEWKLNYEVWMKVRWVAAAAVGNQQRMTVLKRYVLRLFISLKYITANVVDRNNGRIVVTASTVEHSIKNSLECGRSCNAKAAAIVGEVLAMRLKVEGLEQGQGRGIHVDVNKEIEKKGFKNRTKIWAIVNSLKNNGIKLLLEDNDDNTSRPSY